MGPEVVLDEVWKKVHRHNPFTQNIVSGLGDLQVDEPGIHRSAFQQLTRAADAAWDARMGGILLWGEAGLGKSHILVRLSRWCQEKGMRFIYIHNPAASPENIPRYVLECFVADLVNHEDQFKRPLYQLMRQAIMKAIEGKIEPGSKDLTIETTEMHWHAYWKSLSQKNPSEFGRRDREIGSLLFQYCMTIRSKPTNHFRELPELVERWLRGEQLEPEEFKFLKLKGDPSQLSDPQFCAEVVCSLSLLPRAAAGLNSDPKTTLLCFDQIDNLAVDQVSALARHIHLLIDHSRDMLVVSAGLEHTISKLVESGSIQTSSWDRMSAKKIDLQRIEPNPGRRMLEGRLANYFTEFENEPVLKQARTAGTLYPLGDSWFEEWTKERILFRPRDLISAARDRWNLWLDRIDRSLNEKADSGNGTILPPDDKKPPKPLRPEVIERMIDQLIEAKIEEQRSKRQRDSSSLPVSKSNLIGMIEKTLGYCQRLPNQHGIQQLKRLTDGEYRSRGFDLEIWLAPVDGQKSREIRITIPPQNSGTGLTHLVKKILLDSAPPYSWIFLYDARQPLKLGPKGLDYFKRIEADGRFRFKPWSFDFEEFAWLDALTAAVGSAISQDLEISGDSAKVLTDIDVIHSLARQNRFLDRVLLKEILTPPDGPPPPPPPPPPPSIKPTFEQFIMAQLALSPGMETKELAIRYGVRYQSTEKSCVGEMETAALKLRDAGKINAKQTPDGYFLIRQHVSAAR